MKKKSQKELCHLILQENSKKWLPAHHFVGEHVVSIDGEIQYIFLSYKAPARLSDLWNDGLVDRKEYTGISGATYYQYKIK